MLGENEKVEEKWQKENIDYKRKIARWAKRWIKKELEKRENMIWRWKL